jgi:hypothetical protein
MRKTISGFAAYSCIKPLFNINYVLDAYYSTETVTILSHSVYNGRAMSDKLIR